MHDLGAALAAALRQTLKDKKLTIGAAAKRLGVSRQSFQTYLNGKLPRQKMLNKAVQMWDLRLDLGQHSFDKGAFTPDAQRKATPQVQQRTLWEVLDSLREEDLQVRVKRVGKTFRVSVEIEIPA